MNLTRRRINGALTAIGLTTILPRAHAQAQIRLSLGHNSPPASPKGMGATRFAELVQEKSGGRIAVKVAPAEQLGNENALMGAMRMGTLDMGSLGQGAMLSIVPEVAALGLPFLYSSMPTAWEALDGPIGKELAGKLDAKNLVFLGWWCNGIRQTSNSRRPIQRPEDLRGLKIRTPLDPTTVDAFAALGASPQQINWGEVYMALQQKVVDGQENPLANIHAAKLYEVQKYISFTNHKYEATGLMIGAPTWGRLKPQDRELLREAAHEATAFQRRAMFESDEKFLALFRQMPDLSLNEVDLAPFRQATEPVWDQWQQKPFGDFVQRLRASRA